MSGSQSSPMSPIPITRQNAIGPGLPLVKPPFTKPPPLTRSKAIDLSDAMARVNEYLVNQQQTYVPLPPHLTRSPPRAPSRAPSRASSRVPSRVPSRASSSASSRASSPASSPVPYRAPFRARRAISRPPSRSPSRSPSRRRHREPARRQTQSHRPRSPRGRPPYIMYHVNHSLYPQLIPAPESNFFTFNPPPYAPLPPPARLPPPSRFPRSPTYANNYEAMDVDPPVGGLIGNRRTRRFAPKRRLATRRRYRYRN